MFFIRIRTTLAFTLCILLQFCNNMYSNPVVTKWANDNKVEVIMTFKYGSAVKGLTNLNKPYEDIIIVKRKPEEYFNMMFSDKQFSLMPSQVCKTNMWVCDVASELYGLYRGNNCHLLLFGDFSNHPDLYKLLQNICKHSFKKILSKLLTFKPTKSKEALNMFDQLYNYTMVDLALINGVLPNRQQLPDCLTSYKIKLCYEIITICIENHTDPDDYMKSKLEEYKNELQLKVNKLSYNTNNTNIYTEILQYLTTPSIKQ